MSVKLIVFNKNKVFYFRRRNNSLVQGIFKLKNHKSDEGNSVMRRQTWQVSELEISNFYKRKGNGWRKNEYKLINRETYYKPEADGTFSISECQNLQDFPVLVHYFRKKYSVMS